MINLKGKSVIITGSARGIGKEIARKFVDAGANVMISDVDASMAEATAKEFGPSARSIACDVTKKDDVKKLVAATKEAFGSVDVLVNNAGVTKDGMFVRMSEGDWDLVLNINLKGTFLASQAAASAMMRQSAGKIINITSVSGMFGNAGQANYAASKAGVIALTKVMARELAERGINVNAVAPGFIETAMTDKLPDEVKDSIKKHIPFGKMGSVEDVANVTLFLASDAAHYITGQTIPVCGGLTMQS